LNYLFFHVVTLSLRNHPNYTYFALSILHFECHLICGNTSESYFLCQPLYWNQQLPLLAITGESQEIGEAVNLRFYRFVCLVKCLALF